MSKEDRAYCAGLFEGEGHIGCYIKKNPKGYMVRNLTLSIGMQNKEPLELVQDILNVGSLKGPYRNKMYIYAVRNFEHIQFVVCNLWFWLSPRRREQAEIALTTFHSFNLVSKISTESNKGEY